MLEPDRNEKRNTIADKKPGGTPRTSWAGVFFFLDTVFKHPALLRVFAADSSSRRYYS